MTWFRVDDKMGSHPKVLSIPRGQRLAVMGLWLAGATWCAGQLTDGRLPAYMLAELGGSRRQAQMLVESGLWEEAPDGWQFHDWSEYQQTRQQVEDKRETERVRIANKRSSTRSVDTNTAPSTSPVELPDPIQSDPIQEEHPPVLRTDPPTGGRSGTADRGTRLPEGWQPPADLVAEMRLEFPDLTADQWRSLHAEFCDYWHGVPGAKGRKVTWPATWRNSIRRNAPRYRVPQQRRLSGADLDLDAARVRALAREAATA